MHGKTGKVQRILKKVFPFPVRIFSGRAEIFRGEAKCLLARANYFPVAEMIPEWEENPLR